MGRPLTVLIVGGYGTFGGRLARLLSDCAGLTLLIGGRSLERAQEFCSDAREPRAQSGATLRPVRFDRDAPAAEQLRALAPDMVVDASGPFQAYGHAPYRLVEACIACGVHYLDLADSTGFVCGIERFDERARERRVFVLSGVSTFPALTTAVVRRLSVGMRRVDSVVAGAAPSPFVRVGPSVIGAIAAYAGKAVRVREDGGERAAYPFTEMRRYIIAVPGHLPLRPIEFSLVDVPDLRLVAESLPECRSVWMGAGPTPALWHRVFRGLAWLVRLRILPSLSFLSQFMYRGFGAFRWGEHRGGMFARVTGVDASGARVVRSWHLVAEGDAGRFIPSMGAEALVRKCLAGVPPAAGARTATRDVELADYEPLLARHAIRFGVRHDTEMRGTEQSLYQLVLGMSWSSLPESLRAMHSVKTSHTVAGRAQVTRGARWVASLVASMIGFPAAATDVPVQARFDVVKGRETWTRRFGSRVFSSEQFAGRGRWDRLVCERFGPVTLALALVVDARRLRLIVRGWSLFGIPMPRALAPHCDAHEHDTDGRFHFDVAIAHRWTGLIVHYRGWLAPDPTPGSSATDTAARAAAAAKTL